MNLQYPVLSRPVYLWSLIQCIFSSTSRLSRILVPLCLEFMQRRAARNENLGLFCIQSLIVKQVTRLLHKESRQKGDKMRFSESYCKITRRLHCHLVVSMIFSFRD